MTHDDIMAYAKEHAERETELDAERTRHELRKTALELAIQLRSSMSAMDTIKDAEAILAFLEGYE